MMLRGDVAGQVLGKPLLGGKVLLKTLLPAATDRASAAACRHREQQGIAAVCCELGSGSCQQLLDTRRGAAARPQRGVEADAGGGTCRAGPAHWGAKVSPPPASVLQGTRQCCPPTSVRVLDLETACI